MRDIKVFDDLNAMMADQKWWAGKHSPVEFFAEAVARTRNEGYTGVSIKDIARCFKAQFEEEEVIALINELEANRE